MHLESLDDANKFAGNWSHRREVTLHRTHATHAHTWVTHTVNTVNTVNTVLTPFTIYVTRTNKQHTHWPCRAFCTIVILSSPSANHFLSRNRQSSLLFAHTAALQHTLSVIVCDTLPLSRNLSVYVIRMPSRSMCSLALWQSFFLSLSFSLFLFSSRARKKCLPFSLPPLAESHVDRFIHQMKHNAFTERPSHWIVHSVHPLSLSLSLFVTRIHIFTNIVHVNTSVCRAKSYTVTETQENSDSEEERQ